MVKIKWLSMFTVFGVLSGCAAPDSRSLGELDTGSSIVILDANVINPNPVCVSTSATAIKPEQYANLRSKKSKRVYLDEEHKACKKQH